MTVELIRVATDHRHTRSCQDTRQPCPTHDYATPDGRWRVRRNLHGCGPSRWWHITDTTGRWPLKAAVPTLDEVRAYVAHITAGERENEP